MYTIEELEKKGFEGIDADIETSIGEYGFLWGRNEYCGEDEFLFIYRHPYIENRYSTGYLTKKDFSEGFYFNPAHVKSIESFTDQSKEELISDFPNSVFPVIQYYGAINVFGEDYSEGIEILNSEGENIEWN